MSALKNRYNIRSETYIQYTSRAFTHFPNNTNTYKVVRFEALKPIRLSVNLEQLSKSPCVLLCFYYIYAS